MLPLKLTVLQIKPEHARLEVLLNGVHYAPVTVNQPRYLCVDLQRDCISLQTQHEDGQTENWQLDRQTVTDAAAEPQELAIKPNNSLVIRFKLSALKAKYRSPTTYEVEPSFENSFEVQESSIHKDSSNKEEPSLALIAREKGSMMEPSSTIEPETLEHRPNEQLRTTDSIDLVKLDELAQQRQRIINQLFGKLRPERQAAVS